VAGLTGATGPTGPAAGTAQIADYGYFAVQGTQSNIAPGDGIIYNSTAFSSGFSWIGTPFIQIINAGTYQVCFGYAATTASTQLYPDITPPIGVASQFGLSSNTANQMSSTSFIYTFEAGSLLELINPGTGNITLQPPSGSSSEPSAYLTIIRLL
jgi:hypothetical protein